MKTTNAFAPFLVGVLIVGSPFTILAKSPRAKASEEATRQKQIARAAATHKTMGPGFDSQGRPREYVVITRETTTGSHVPRVYRYYGNHVDVLNSNSNFVRVETNRFGASDVAGILRYDPAITFRGRL